MDAAPEDELKLFGIWSSPYVHRVQLALKLKGLHYEYVEEDLANKSPSLLRLNPVYKKVPVLLHGDRPIVESVVIVEYIDETWRDRYPLMPTDPRERAAVRFWCHFATDKLGLSFWEVFRTTGEEQRAAVRVALDNLKLLEDELREGLFRGRRFFGGEKMGFLDVVLGCGFHGLLASEEATGTGPLRLDEDFPCFVKWVRDFRAQAEVEEIIPAHDKWLEHIKGVRQLAVNSIMSWYRALESGKFWFPAQVYNRGKGHPGFMLSCYDAQLSYDCRTHTFTARYPPHGGRTMVIEEGVQWERLRAPPVDTPAHGLHTSDCLNDLRPGDHIEVQWRMNKEVPYGWWYGVIGHLDSCGGNKFHCRCHNSDTVILEFNQYATGSRWRLATINRKDHREEGNATDGFYGGIRKLYSMEEIATWRRLWPTDILE